MSAVLAGGIEGISARYAAQIRELLYVQAMKRMAAEQEAVRAEAAALRQAAFERSSPPVEPVEEAVKVDPETIKHAEAAEPVKAPEPKEPAPQPVPPAQIIDEKA